MIEAKVMSRIQQIGLVAICVFNLLYMHYYIIMTSNIEQSLDCTSPIDNLTGVLIDTTIIFLAACLITNGRFKASTAITFTLTCIWAFCNIFYSRFFNSYLPLSAISQGTSLTDPLVINSMFSGFKWDDLYFIIITIIFVKIYKKTPSISIKMPILVMCSSLILMIICDLIAHASYCWSIPEFRYFSYYHYRINSRHFAEHNKLCNPIFTTFHRGCARILSYDILEELQNEKELSKDDEKNIVNYIKESQESLIQFEDTTNIHKNIIFIIVESYMSFTSDMKVQGKEITPFLNSLRHDSTIYYNGHLAPNITIGESSDGQYIYMTGLLPLKSHITVSKAQSKVLPGLAFLLQSEGYKSQMIIPTAPTMWNQSTMCKQYGIAQLFSANDYNNNSKQELNDQEVFELASKIDHLNKDEKFFSVVLTISMHQPYLQPIDTQFVLEDNEMPTQLRNYLIACHYTDKCISEYIARLKSEHLYDNSIIIITADHHVHGTDFGIENNEELPLYIINSGIDNQNAWQGACNQIDVYTTLINLLNIKSDWCGLGHSLLRPNYKKSLNNTKWEISEIILKSNYFKK